MATANPNTISKTRLFALRRELARKIEEYHKLIDEHHKFHDYVTYLLDTMGEQGYGYPSPRTARNLDCIQQLLTRPSSSMETITMPAIMPTATTGKLPELHPSPRERTTDPIPLSQMRQFASTGPIPMLHEQTVPLSDVWMKEGWIFTRHTIKDDLQEAIAESVLRHRHTVGKRAQYLYVNQINKQLLELKYPHGHYQDEQGTILTVMNPELSANEVWCATRIPPQAQP